MKKIIILQQMIDLPAVITMTSNWWNWSFCMALLSLEKPIIVKSISFLSFLSSFFPFFPSFLNLFHPHWHFIYLPHHVRVSLTDDASLSLHRAVKVVVGHLLAGKNVVIDGIFHASIILSPPPPPAPFLLPFPNSTNSIEHRHKRAAANSQIIYRSH